MLQAILNWLANYISYFPLVIFIGLFLGGLNIPISEDFLVIMAAVMSHDNKSSMPYLLISLYAGAVVSDYMVYFWGRLIGKGAVSIQSFAKVINKERTCRLLTALNRYGVFTYIVTRFIPFGIRNMVSLTSGFVKYPFYKFAIFDLIAALCNISTLFFLVYFFGKAGSNAMKIFGTILFILFLALCFYLIKSGKLNKLTDNKDSTLK